MWTEIQANGKVKFVERYTNPITGKISRVGVTLDNDNRKNQKLARELIDQKIDQKLLSFHIGVKNNKMTLRELTALYTSYKIANMKANTYKRDITACHMFIEILGGDCIVNNMTSGYVFSRFKEHDQKNGTINERIKRFKTLIHWGYTNDYISNLNCIEKLNALPNKERKAKLEEKFLEKDELNTLINSMTITKWKLLTQFNALSGLRIGESIALELNDIDFENKLIHVNKNYEYMNDGTISDTKTAASDRDVYMQPELESICHQIITEMKKQKIRYMCSSDLFFYDINGNHIQYAAYNKYLKEVSARVLDKNISITTHVMRHTHTALMAEAGVPLDVISRRLGHENSEITRSIYFHVTKKLQERDNQLISKISIL